MKDSNEHYYEACYIAWRNQIHPDNIQYDESDDDYYNELPPEYTAQREINRAEKIKEIHKQQDEEMPY